MQKFCHTISDIISLGNLNVGTLPQQDGYNAGLGLEGKGKVTAYNPRLFPQNISLS